MCGGTLAANSAIDSRVSFAEIERHDLYVIAPGIRKHLLRKAGHALGCELDALDEAACLLGIVDAAQRHLGVREHADEQVVHVVRDAAGHQT